MSSWSGHIFWAVVVGEGFPNAIWLPWRPGRDTGGRLRLASDYRSWEGCCSRSAVITCPFPGDSVLHVRQDSWLSRL